MSKRRDYNPMDIFNSDQDIRKVLMQLINGFYSAEDSELFRDLYNSLLNTQCTQYADTLRVEGFPLLRRGAAESPGGLCGSGSLGADGHDERGQRRKILLRPHDPGYVDDIWHLDKITVRK